MVEEKFKLGILKLADISDLLTVAQQWVKFSSTREVDEGEMTSIKKKMLLSLNSNEYQYYVIRKSNGKAIGCTAIREPEEVMQKYKSSIRSKSRELVNVFLSDEYRGKGLGYKLLEFTFEKAKDLGFEEIIWNSGPRYKDSAWGFYTKLAGKLFDLAPNFYGKGNDAPVWRKIL